MTLLGCTSPSHLLFTCGANVGAKLQVAAALIPLSQALYANGDLGPARQSCTRALQILQMAYKERPSVEVGKQSEKLMEVMHMSMLRGTTTSLLCQAARDKQNVLCKTVTPGLQSTRREGYLKWCSARTFSSESYSENQRHPPHTRA